MRLDAVQDTGMKAAGPAGGLLAQLLRQMRAGGLRTTEDMARQMGVSEGLVAAMTDNLVRRGYLQALESGCEEPCSGCALTGSCGMKAAPSPSRFLALTPKGRAAAGG